MRVEEYLRYRGRLERLPRKELGQSVDEVLNRCLIVDVRRQIIGTLSKGYRQRVGLAAAILHRPRVLVLDEPTVGLDPKQIIAIRELIRELGRERTLLLSTHILPEVELLCNRVMIIDRGRIVAEGTPESLRETQVGNPAVRILLKDAPAGAGEALATLPGVTAVRAGSGDGTWVIEHERAVDLREGVFREAVQRGWVLLEMTRERASLEDIFVRLTTHDVAAGAAATAEPDEPAAPAPPTEETAS
jgi:ABC-2 type transport system ATP-binding protein